MDEVHPSLVKYAKKIVEQYSYDASHGLDHFERTAVYAWVITHGYENSLIPGISACRAKAVVVNAAYAHDLVDRKYRPAQGAAIEELRAVLVADCGFSANEADAATGIISMSPFSVRNSRVAAGLPQIPEGPLCLAASILSDADQIDAYRVERCVEYTQKKYGHLTRRERLARIEDILKNRVLLYKDRYMLTDLGARLAIGPHAALESVLNSNTLGDYVS